MRVLVDTHAFLWWVRGDQALSRRARFSLEEAASEVVLSVASAWEIAIKYGLGKLALPAPPDSYLPRILRERNVQPLDVTLAHASAVAALPDHHRDPFDRLIVAQAQLEGLPLITVDPLLRRYGVEVVW